MYCQYTATRFKVAFPRQVINSIQHFPGINRLYQYPGIGNKLFDEADELVISFGISAKIIFSVQLVCGRGGSICVYLILHKSAILKNGDGIKFGI